VNPTAVAPLAPTVCVPPKDSGEAKDTVQTPLESAVAVATVVLSNVTVIPFSPAP